MYGPEREFFSTLRGFMQYLPRLCISGLLCFSFSSCLDIAFGPPPGKEITPEEEVSSEEIIPLEEITEETIVETESDEPESLDETPPSSIEIVWRVPAGPVTAFLILYGSDPEKLSSSVRLPVEDLEKYDDPNQGPVYRYYLQGVPPSLPVYVSMVSENSAGKSAPSEPILLRKASASE